VSRGRTLRVLGLLCKGCWGCVCVHACACACTCACTYVGGDGATALEKLGRREIREKLASRDELTIIQPPPPIVHRPSSIVHRPSSIAHRPSPIAHTTLRDLRLGKIYEPQSEIYFTFSSASYLSFHLHFQLRGCTCTLLSVQNKCYVESVSNRLGTIAASLFHGHNYCWADFFLADNPMKCLRYIVTVNYRIIWN
jgi:hypothetical protein